MLKHFYIDIGVMSVNIIDLMFTVGGLGLIVWSMVYPLIKDRTLFQFRIDKWDIAIHVSFYITIASILLATGVLHFWPTFLLCIFAVLFSLLVTQWYRTFIAVSVDKHDSAGE